jgi:hypothetical protein
MEAAMNDENVSQVEEMDESADDQDPGPSFDERDDWDDEPEERDSIDDSMDGDHESALESVYGPDNDCDGYEEREDFGDFDYPGCDD